MDVTPYNLAGWYQRYIKTCFFHLQGVILGEYQELTVIVTQFLSVDATCSLRCMKAAYTSALSPESNERPAVINGVGGIA
jgi:hypothetical protein